ncbi:MAG: cobyrinate a,c-diamide synthase [Beijerinckiaceae bacterium]
MPNFCGASVTGAALRRLRERMGRLFVSAIHKSSGKTTISLGLAAALTARGLSVQTFKKGPDYIDPMWLSRASHRVCYNLDFNTQSDAEILSTFRRGSQGADMALIEGNKGLHDGLDREGSDSSAALAKLLRAPVVVVVDVVGMMRGIAPLMLGYAAFDPQVEIAGVILNKVGIARQESKLRQALERYTDIPVLGAIGRDEGLTIDERHLGLTTPDETSGFSETVAQARDVVLRGVDLDRLMTIAEAAGNPAGPAAVDTPDVRDVSIAVARDRAFGFYYADDFEALERAGANLIFFDALKDATLPSADALFIGGGFPETQAAALAANVSLRAQVREVIAAGLPTYAECGGLMYLTRSITWRGKTHEMVAAVPADTIVRDRPQGRGLVILEETADALWPHSAAVTAIPAHEFHYAALENVDPACRFAYRMRRGFGVDGRHDGIVIGNLLASFSHLRDTSRHHWARRFLAFIRETRERQAPALGRLTAKGQDPGLVSRHTGGLSKKRSAG